MKSVRFFIPALIILLISCSEDEPKKKVSGYFKLVQVQSPNSRASARISSTQETSIDLGSIKASREFYFVLANGGENDITDIELTTDNPAFIISPASISVLAAEGSGSEALVPLVSLGIEHGLRLNGVGYSAALPMGTNSAMLTITGSTIENGETILLESTFTITIDAKLMDITLFTDDAEIDFSNPVSQHTTYEYESGLPAIPGYEFNPENLKIKNTGNVDVTVRLLHWSVGSEVLDEIALSVGETKTISTPEPEGDYYLGILQIEGNGTVTNRTRLKQGIDGKGYVIIQYTETVE